MTEYVCTSSTYYEQTSLERQLNDGRAARIISDKISMYLSGLTMAARQKAAKLSVSDHKVVVAGCPLVLRWTEGKRSEHTTFLRLET